MGIETIIQVYIAFFIVVLLHELGHFPKSIKFKFGLLPSGSAMNAKYRLGGLIVNAALAIGIYINQPTNTFIQLIGALAWIHLIIYLIVGSFNKEPKDKEVNLATYVWDDVPNEYWMLNIAIAISLIVTLQQYYIPIFQALW